MISLRAADSRGKADFGWLQSNHSFSFGSYYNPKETGHGNLIVINDDFVEPGQGFGTHPHRNMEILSYVLEGTIAHRDSEGNEHHVPAGDFQLMSAGSGITHSEFNPSREASLNFLQIWIRPNVTGTQPGYQQKGFGNSQKAQLILSPDGGEGSLVIKQNAWLTLVRLGENESFSQDLARSKTSYIHVVSGKLAVNGEWSLKAGDGLKLTDESEVSVQANSDKVELLLFEA